MARIPNFKRVELIVIVDELGRVMTVLTAADFDGVPRKWTRYEPVSHDAWVGLQVGGLLGLLYFILECTVEVVAYQPWITNGCGN